MADVIDFYQERIKFYSESLEAIDKRIRQISYKRLTSILFVVVCLFAAFQIETYWLIPAAALFALFLIYVNQHTKLFQERILLAELLLINQKETDFINGDKTVFDVGIDIDPGRHGSPHLYALDVDIFGVGSLFQSINRSSTRSGRELLTELLLSPLDNEAQIVKRRAAIHDLSKETDWRQIFYAIGTRVDEKANDHNKIKDWLGLPDFFIGRNYWKVITIVMTLISGSVILYCIVTSQFLIAFLATPLLICTILLSFLSKSIKEYFFHFGSRAKRFKKYADLFEHISRQKFESDESEQLQKECTNASRAFVKLFQLSSLTDQRSGMLGSLMNGFFMFDLWCIYRIEEWRKENKDSFPSWINSLITIDAISSFANFTFNHPDFQDAIIQNDKQFISAKEMGHPLMDSKVSIKNDYEIGVSTKIHVITGSNMAGKSTFIRALGVNLILAKNGVPVCAKEFKCSTLGLITSIRISDSLEENASYFKAELIRLEKILSQLKTGQPFLVLLDEILRGTNSDDKRLGTQSFLLKLKQFNCLVLLATHDLNIGKLEQEFPGYVENYCFESQFTNEGLSFDYKLRKGVSSSTNATFLMKKMGLID